MDAIELLKADHDKVRGLFEEFKQAKEAEASDRMRDVQQQIFSELETHTRLEEDIFYPAVRELDEEEMTETVAEGIQEHHVVKVLMREVEEVKGDETFESKMAVLIENVEHHADEEEDELFPELREKVTQEWLDDIGAQMEAAR
ncbi:MAG TPA: hemerythrin domain-containing protein [Acidimicrobiales bacterium]|nr:hemerythrin domain-containing protein [Acidimicrobiales bacterium]